MAFQPNSLGLPIIPSFSSSGTSWPSIPFGGIRGHNPTPSSAGVEDPSYVQEEGRFSGAVASAPSSWTSDIRTLNQPQAKRQRMEHPSSSQGSSSDTSGFQTKPLDLTNKKYDKGVKKQRKPTTQIFRKGEQIHIVNFAGSDEEKKQLDASLGEIKKFNETEFEYSDGVIAATSLGDQIRRYKEFFKQENEQKSIIVLSKGESVPDDLKKLRELVDSGATNFNVALFRPRLPNPFRHYKFIFKDGFELHVAEISQFGEACYFGRFGSNTSVFYQLEKPTFSNGIQKILNEKRMWQCPGRKVDGKTIVVKTKKGVVAFTPEMTNFPSLWYAKGLVILYGRFEDAEERDTLLRCINSKNVCVTRENVKEEANEKLHEQPCEACLKYTFKDAGDSFELYRVRFSDYSHCKHWYYLRNMHKPHVFFILDKEYEETVERRLLAKSGAATVQQTYHTPVETAGTFVSTQRARRSQLGKITEKKTTESNYQGLVLVSMVSCLVLVSTCWALGKKEENDAATRGSHSRSK